MGKIAGNQEVVTAFSMLDVKASQVDRVNAMASNYYPNDEERGWMRPLAAMAFPPFVPADPDKLTATIMALTSVLPKQPTDLNKGRMALKVYKTRLAHLTDAEVEEAARRCADELDWFPTIRQFKERAAGYGGSRVLSEEQALHAKIRKLLKNRPPANLKPVTEEERKEILETFNELLKGINPKSRCRPDDERRES